MPFWSAVGKPCDFASARRFFNGSSRRERIRPQVLEREHKIGRTSIALLQTPDMELYHECLLKPFFVEERHNIAHMAAQFIAPVHIGFFRLHWACTHSSNTHTTKISPYIEMHLASSWQPSSWEKEGPDLGRRFVRMVGSLNVMVGAGPLHNGPLEISARRTTRLSGKICGGSVCVQTLACEHKFTTLIICLLLSTVLASAVEFSFTKPSQLLRDGVLAPMRAKQAKQLDSIAFQCLSSGALCSPKRAPKPAACNLCGLKIEMPSLIVLVADRILHSLPSSFSRGKKEAICS